LLISAQAFAQAPETSRAPSDFEEFALRESGDAMRGQAVFARATCALCHTVDGTSKLAGPDLFAIGDKFARRDLIFSVLEPSAAIAIGYETTTIEKKSGEVLMGVVKGAGDGWTEIMGVDGKRVRVEAADIASRTSTPQSLMPSGLQGSISLQDFADLISYLGSLRQPASQLAQRGFRDEIARAAGPVSFEPVFDAAMHFERPVWFGEIPGRTGAFVVLEHYGASWIVESSGGTDARRPFVDLSRTVRPGGATGLLGFAFHPKFTENRRYYLKYQVEKAGRISTLVVERQFAADFRADSGQPSRVLLQIPSSTQDHNGGSLAFGPDGFLYIGMGDTGPQRDPQGHGQDQSILLGKLLRIDVDRIDDGRAYGIPRNNPFVGVPNVRPEIWALGFREPWRISFDSKTNDLWVGDVGQDRYEEVSIVRAGENHGWNVIEGFAPFSEEHRRGQSAFVPPVLSYSHRVGVSVTGGYVYRGARAPAMNGWYICADFESRRIFALTEANRGLQKVVEIGRAPSRAVSFTQLRDGELCLVGYDSGMFYRLRLDQVDPTPMETRMIAATAEREPISWRITELAPTDESWMRPEFDDSGWRSAAAGFGSAGTPGAIVRTDWRTRDLWLRRDFSVPDTFKAEGSRALALRIHHDEDTEVYLNGIEVARMPRWTTGYTEIPLSAEAADALRAGRNTLAIHCHQNTGGQYIDCGLVEYVRPVQ
jgi:putative heme-binding domain-containing protein